jgi:hypothetical protein
MKRSNCLALVCMVCVVGTSWLSHPSRLLADPKKPAEPDQTAVENARRTVKMLDQIYKTTIVLVTEKYVLEEDDFAAGSAAVLLFKQISEGGTHQVRLIDATGQPYEEANVAKDDFEKQGIKQLKGGAANYEKIVQKDGANILRVMTPVPVVMERCTMCHEHYKTVKAGEPIGAISYSIPIQ